MTLTEGDLLQAISDAVQNAGAAVPDGPIGATSREVADHLGILHSSASRELSRAVRQGVLVAEKSFRRNIVGDLYKTPVYRPAEVVHE